MSTQMVTDQVEAHLPHEHLDAHVQLEPLLNRLTSQAPWWLVSVIFHVLLLICAYMFSIAININTEENEPIVIVSQINAHVDQTEEKKAVQKDASFSPLSAKRDTPPTDPMSKEMSEILVPADILKMAQLSDHDETINLERPDTRGALGTPDSHIFHSVTGCAEPPGGGAGGMVLEDMIGSGGPRRSAFGDGHGSGIGRDNGPGRGSFGGRNDGGRRFLVKRRGGCQATQDAVKTALQWLAYHQETDGHWDAKKYASGEKTDTAVTGLALLAFLGYGNSEKVGEYKDNVKRALSWLKSKQAPNGLIWDTTDAGGHRGEGYPGAIATLALAEASAMANVPETREAAQRAVNYFTEIHQAGEGSDKQAWRYHPKMEGDTSVTGWVIMALKSAKIAGLQVNHASFDGAIKYLDSVEHRAPGGDPGYAPASTYWYTVKDAHEPHRLTAIGCLCRQFLGWKKEDMQASIDGFVAAGGVPAWGGNGASVDLYYWYYGSLCTFQQDGPVWKKWNEGLMSALVPNQRKEADDAGSWDPVGAFAGEWGRVGETALGCLCLEVYYRYAQLNAGH